MLFFYMNVSESIYLYAPYMVGTIDAEFKNIYLKETIHDLYRNKEIDKASFIVFAVTQINLRGYYTATEEVMSDI